jgi:AGCS family alanine or glycine:cation symporter
MQAFHELIIWLNGYLWGPPMLFLLFGTHLFLTCRLGFIQKYVGKAIRLSVSKDEAGEGDVSQFGALTTALAATIGTGNIVGVATAIGLGGPGAVLWCWLTGVFGMATKYAEALLAVKYRVKTSDGMMLGGPMYVLEKGVHVKWLAVLFAIFTAMAAFGIGNMVQANSIATMVRETFAISPYISGGIIAVITAMVILGGVKSIAAVCEKLVPFMAIFYVVGCVALLMMNSRQVIPAIALIFQSAFTPQAAGGGFVGASLMIAARYGVARGLFSNESGLGSAPIVAAAAQTKNPVRQALVSMTGTFWDTVVVCALTGIVLVSSVLSDPVALNQLSGAVLSKAAFTRIPVLGPVILTVGLLTFVFSTILGWSYYGERAVEYLLGKKVIIPYRIAWIIAVFIGSVNSLALVWDLADAMNAMMTVPNLIALIALSGVCVAETHKYLGKAGGLDRASEKTAASIGSDLGVAIVKPPRD